LSSSPSPSPSGRSERNGTPPVRRGLAIAGSLAASCARSRTAGRGRRQQQPPQPASPSAQFLPAPQLSSNSSNPAVYNDATVSDLLQILQGSTAPHLARFRDFLLDKKVQNYENSAVGSTAVAIANGTRQRQPLMQRSCDNGSNCNGDMFPAMSVAKKKSSKKVTRQPDASLSCDTSSEPQQQQQPQAPAQTQSSDSANRRRSASYPTLLTELASSIQTHLSRSATSANVNALVKAACRANSGTGNANSSVNNSTANTTAAIVKAIDNLDKQASAIGPLLDCLAAEAERLNDERQRLTAVVAATVDRLQQQQQAEDVRVRSVVPTASVECQTDLAWVDVQQTMADEREQYALQVGHAFYGLGFWLAKRIARRDLPAGDLPVEICPPSFSRGDLPAVHFARERIARGDLPAENCPLRFARSAIFPRANLGGKKLGGQFARGQFTRGKIALRANLGGQFSPGKSPRAIRSRAKCTAGKSPREKLGGQISTGKSPAGKSRRAIHLRAFLIEYLNYELAQLSERFEQSEYYECKYRAENCEFLMSLRDTKLSSLRDELQSAASQMKAASAAAAAASDGPESTAAMVADTCDRLCQIFADSLEDGLRHSVLQLCADVKRC
uniref:Reverse transcriptase domain-containing protein n=1 Tax=Macrostomum lignano TaxID=282301 RepID=A0A1I8G523_9PLAT